MEVAQRYSIAYKGLHTGSHDFCFEVGESLFEQFDSTEIKGGKCVARVCLERGESMLELAVKISGSVVVACDRCLEDCDVPVDFEGRLVVKISADPGEYDGEVMWLLPSEDEIDLAQYIYESIVLSLPYQRVHPEGQCDPEMLERFRIVSGQEFADIEAKAEEHTEGEWAKLAALKKQMEKESGKGSKK